ncbi:N-acyl homoserine lactonase AttM [Grifola frondosa]|uniref:N-acyl homoserine lactonase AttM n=1 Tax=Grifola frondosa TaxID=5627 RepID=A0A1C7M306_GRIFR|nr:N-acyl homoserine lactonase AttM [Grifola frondosa]
MEVAYGHQSQGAQDPFVIASRLMVQRFVRANRLNFYAVDWFPFHGLLMEQPNGIWTVYDTGVSGEMYAFSGAGHSPNWREIGGSAGLDNMAQTDITIALPIAKPGQAYMHVSALEAGIIHIPLHLFMADAAPTEISVCPSLAFSLRHSTSNSHLVFDLGLRRDMESHPPAVKAVIEKWYPVSVPQSVDESLKKGGLDPADVKTIILSHLHFDHTGDAASFPNATFVLGEGSAELIGNGFPSNPKSQILQSVVPAERTRFLTAAEFNTSMGPFPRAYDYFGDGSLYLVDAIGHLAGHINVLARTSADDSWIYLAGDTAHDVRILTGERGMAFTVDPTGHIHCAHAHKDDAIEHIRRVGTLLKIPKVHVLLAHEKEWYEKNKGGDAFFPGTIPPKL